MRGRCDRHGVLRRTADAPAQHFDDPGFLDFGETVLHLDRYLLAEDNTEAYEFNDARDRTLDQVLTALRQAADTPTDDLVAAVQLLNGRDATAVSVLEATPMGAAGVG